MPNERCGAESDDSCPRRFLAKAGKSTLSVTSPEPRLLCDVEAASRFLPIKRVYWNPDDPPPEYDGTWDTCVVPTRAWTTVEKVYQWLNTGKHPFKTFIIDSISELQNRFIEQEAGRRQLTQAQWGNAYRAVGGLVRDIRDLTMHPTKPLECVVMTAMTRQIDGKFRPWCQGQLQSVLPYLLDAVVYIYVDREVDDLSGESREVRRILTRPTDQFEAGERVGGKWPVVVTDPDINDLIGMVFDTEPPADGEEFVLSFRDAETAEDTDDSTNDEETPGVPEIA